MSTQYATVVAYYLVTYQQCFNLKLQQYFKLQYSTRRRSTSTQRQVLTHVVGKLSSGDVRVCECNVTLKLHAQTRDTAVRGGVRVITCPQWY